MSSSGESPNPIIVALDERNGSDAVRLAKSLRPHVGGFKVGLELIMGVGPAMVGAIADLGLPVFADAKLHDIPNTVERAARHLGSVGARWVTVHGSGGREMVAAAEEGLASSTGDRPGGILVVTVLTSIDSTRLASVGMGSSVGKQVARLSRIANEVGVEGVVCSVREVGDVAQVAPDLVRVVPGIRPAGADHHDQASVATPEEALARGADWLVIGRAITRAPDPIAAAESITADLHYVT
ncbi:MAG: orotidine-5'-phosphate decarboxylase [Acidimicrobiia bacterium]|nr:orotidine-5'-phosphate decarboxylase [Acidimicrobiia bacterium]